MNIFFLKYFFDTVRHGSITKAAEENHVTKSAISQGIMQLEKSLDVFLLTHKRNRLKVTDEGASVYESSRALFQHLEDLKSSLKKPKKQYAGSLSLACSHSLALAILPKILKQIRTDAPHIQLKVLFGHTGMIKQWLKQNTVEIGLVLDNDDLSPFTLEPVYKGAFRIYESVHRQNSTIKSCLFPPARVEVFAIKQAYYEKYGYELKTEMEICSWEVIAQLVALDQGVGLIPDYISWDKQKAELIRPADIDLSFPYQLYIAYPSREILSKNAQYFVQLLKNTLSQEVGIN